MSAVSYCPKHRLLLLSVGYGQGHHAAAAAVAEHYAAHGWETGVVDVLELAQPVLFRLSQRFYDFCVRRAPWLWGVTYSLTDTADWSRLVRFPLFRRVVACLQQVLEERAPDVVICTYPLFAYMLDELRRQGHQVPPYAVLVTDALEISRPWMRSGSPLVMVTDEISCRMMRERYALAEDEVVATGFPVRRAFVPLRERRRPEAERVRLVYGAYRRPGGVMRDIEALLGTFPHMRITMIAGRRAAMLRRRLQAYCAAGQLEIIASVPSMHAILAESHFYVGKAGAATMFECYATQVPMLVNFTLPGQERGNLDLLVGDGAGCHVESSMHLVSTIAALLRDDAAGWQTLCDSMSRAGRTGAAGRVAQAVKTEFGI